MSLAMMQKEPLLQEGGNSPMDPLPPVWDTDGERPYGFCGLCDTPIWEEAEAFGPYSSAVSVGIVCGDCAKWVTRGVL